MDIIKKVIIQNRKHIFGEVDFGVCWKSKDM